MCVCVFFLRFTAQNVCTACSRINNNNVSLTNLNKYRVLINYRRISEPFLSNTGLRFSREMAVATIGPFQMYTFTVCNRHEFHDIATLPTQVMA